MRHPRAGLGLAALQGKLYAAGGWRDRQYSRAVERFDPLTDRWTDLPGLQERRGKLGLVRQQQSQRWPADAGAQLLIDPRLNPCILCMVVAGLA